MSHVRGNPETEVGRNLNRTGYRVHLANPIEGGRKTVGKSDWPIVLGARESRVHGEGASRGTESTEETSAGHEGLENRCKPHCGEYLLEPIGLVRSEYHGRARCGNFARRDLCGGGRATGRPTAMGSSQEKTTMFLITVVMRLAWIMTLTIFLFSRRHSVVCIY